MNVDPVPVIVVAAAAMLVIAACLTVSYPHRVRDAWRLHVSPWSAERIIRIRGFLSLFCPHTRGLHAADGFDVPDPQPDGEDELDWQIAAFHATRRPYTSYIPDPERDPVQYYALLARRNAPPVEDTVLDVSMCAAIREATDGVEYTHHLVNRYFDGQIDVEKIFAPVNRWLAGVSQ